MTVPSEPQKDAGSAAPPVEISATGRRDPARDALFLRAPVATQSAGGAGSFIALGSDGQKWRVKPPNTPQGPKILVAEHLVAQLGELIGAPVCHVEPMWIGQDHVGWEFRSGQPLVEGFGSASLEVSDVVEVRGLVHRREDDNARRHVGVYALYDWCWGADDQWLYQGGTGNTLFSHDHGLYLWSGDWGAIDLAAVVADGHVPAYERSGLDVGAIAATAARLRGLTASALNAVLAKVPAAWPVTDAELVRIGRFLLERAALVADRLEAA